MGIRDDELDAAQTAPGELAQEVGPEGLGLRRADRQAQHLAPAVATAFAQDDAEAARTQWRQVADQLRPRVKKLAELMDEAESDVLAYMSFPPAHRPN